MHKVALALVVTACSVTEPPAPTSDTCESNVVPMVTTRVDGVADTQVVPIVVDGRDAWLAIDTGSQRTFVFRDEYEEDAAVLTIGCEQRSVPGYGEAGIGVEEFEGKPILGILGLEFFGDVGEIDYPGGTITRHASLPADVARLPHAPFVNRDDRGLVDLEIDAVPVRMMLDTGAPSTLWLGVEGNEGDERGQVQTADGRLWDVWFGQGEIALAGERRVVPVTRGLAIPYIGPELEELGAQGLLGVTSLGWRRFVWDTPNGLIYFDARR